MLAIDGVHAIVNVDNFSSWSSFVLDACGTTRSWRVRGHCRNVTGQTRLDVENAWLTTYFALLWRFELLYIR
jgi:hypothetical protein